MTLSESYLFKNNVFYTYVDIGNLRLSPEKA